MTLVISIAVFLLVAGILVSFLTWPFWPRWAMRALRIGGVVLVAAYVFGVIYVIVATIRGEAWAVQ